MTDCEHYLMKKINLFLRFTTLLLTPISEAALQRCSYENVLLKICSKFTREHPSLLLQIMQKIGILPIELTRYKDSLIFKSDQ